MASSRGPLQQHSRGEHIPQLALHEEREVMLARLPLQMEGRDSHTELDCMHIARKHLLMMASTKTWMGFWSVSR